MQLSIFIYMSNYLHLLVSLSPISPEMPLSDLEPSTCGKSATTLQSNQSIKIQPPARILLIGVLTIRMYRFHRCVIKLIYGSKHEHRQG